MDLDFMFEHLPRLIKATKLTIQLTLLSLFFGIFVGIFFVEYNFSLIDCEKSSELVFCKKKLGMIMFLLEFDQAVSFFLAVRQSRIDE